MSKILEKLGIYDLLVLLFTGILILTMSVYAHQWMADIERNIASKEYLSEHTYDAEKEETEAQDESGTEGISKVLTGQLSETLTFLVCSYLTGLIFQEVSSKLMRWFCFRNSRLLMRAIRSKKKCEPRLEETERKALEKARDEVIENMLANTGNRGKKQKWSIFYNYCKCWLYDKGKIARIEQDQVTAGISRSLSLFFFIESMLFLGRGAWMRIPSYLGGGVISLVLAVVLYYRFVRFAQNRYILVLRQYYYADLCEKMKKEKQTQQTT